MSTPPDDASSRRAARLTELDGLRGLAAVVVLIDHCLQTVPSIAAVGTHPGVTPDGALERILTGTPLHLLWAGHEAVLVFFVLSGVALVYPIARRHARSQPFDWVDYAPRRVVRLWLPAAASTTWAMLLVVLVPRSTDPALGSWMTTGHPPGLSVDQQVLEFLLISQHSYRNTVLWSLHAEAIFSIMLPVVVALVALAARRRLSWALLGAALAVPLATGSLGWGRYLPVFTIGAVLGWSWGHLDRPLPPRPRPWATPLALLCLLLITIAWWPPFLHGALQHVALSMTTAAVTCLVVLAVRAGALRGLLRSRAVQYLGTMSFSLYLVHEPVVVAVRLLTASWSPWWMLVLAPLASAPLTILFHRFIEAPSHRLSREVGRRASARFRRRRGADAVGRPDRTRWTGGDTRVALEE